MNLAQLETSFRVDTDDTVKPYGWSSEDFIRWLNEAQVEACARGQLIFEKTTSRLCEIAVTAAAGSVYTLHPLVNEIVYATLIDANNCVTPLGLKDREELDRLNPNWRANTCKPENIIHRDNTIELDAIISQPYTIKLEIYRLPMCDMVKETDKPEINQIHHIHLIEWVKHKAYAVPDSDYFDKNKSEEAEARFIDYFGERPTADMRKAENANLPHTNKAYW